MYRVLIIEDDQLSIEILKRTLPDSCEAITVSAGDIAVPMALDIKPDLILLDLHLPELDGFSVLREIRADPALSLTPVIVITAHAFKQNEIAAFELDVDDFISKPINSDTTKQRIAALLRRINHCSYTSFDFKHLMNMLSEAVFLIDQDGTIRQVNHYGLNLLGYTPNELLSHNVKKIVPTWVRDQHDALMATFLQTGQPSILGVPRTFQIVSKSGREIPVDFNLFEFRDGEKRLFITILRDIRARERINTRLIHAAYTDELTGLASMMTFRRDYNLLLEAEDPQGSVLAFMLDIDNFYQLNATLGHHHCDDLLRDVARELTDIAKVTLAKPYRLMSDRFLMCYFDSSKAKIDSVKLQLNKAIPQAISNLNLDLDFDITMTTSSLTHEIRDFNEEDLIQMLEVSLVEAKQSQFKGKIIEIDQAKHVKSIQYIELMQELGSHQNESTLSVVYQPKVDFSGRILEVEALLRWHHPYYTELNLFDYISAAEKTKAIVWVGHFVLKQVCSFIASLGQHAIPVSVNLSPREPLAPFFIDYIKETCQSFEVDTSLLTFELTESSLSDDFGCIKKILEQLDSNGFRISVDDFGTGLSNLRYVSELPISELKIDKSFIDRIDDAQGNYPVIESIHALAQAMGMRVTAEGVENYEQLNYLARLGCDLIQGYLFYKPLPEHEIKALLVPSQIH